MAEGIVSAEHWKQANGANEDKPRAHRALKATPRTTAHAPRAPRPDTVRSMGLGAALDRNAIQRQALARELRVTPETVSRWISGAITPGWLTMLLIVQFLRRFEPGLHVEDLFSRRG